MAARSPLAFWRQRAGLTQKRSPTEFGVSQAYLAQLEASEREGGVKVWAQLADAIGVRIEDLINNTLSLPEKRVDKNKIAHGPRTSRSEPPIFRSRAEPSNDLKNSDA